MISVVVPIYYQQTKKEVVMMGLNWYRNTHYMHLNKAKKFMHSVVADNVEGEPILEGNVHVKFVIYAKRGGTDGGNVRSVIEKFVLDALKAERYIDDDKIEIINSDDSEYFYDKKNPRAEITLTKKDEKIHGNK